VHAGGESSQAFDLWGKYAGFFYDYRVLGAPLDPAMLSSAVDALAPIPK